MTSQQAKALARWYKTQRTMRGCPAYLPDMIDQMQKIDDEKINKLMRWLGFLQGSMFVCGVYTVEQLKNHSRIVSQQGEASLALFDQS